MLVSLSVYSGCSVQCVCVSLSVCVCVCVVILKLVQCFALQAYVEYSNTCVCVVFEYIHSLWRKDSWKSLHVCTHAFSCVLIYYSLTLSLFLSLFFLSHQWYWNFIISNWSKCLIYGLMGHREERERRGEMIYHYWWASTTPSFHWSTASFTFITSSVILVMTRESERGREGERRG